MVGETESQGLKRFCGGRDMWGSAVLQQVLGTVTVRPVKQGTEDERSSFINVTALPGEIPGSLFLHLSFDLIVQPPKLCCLLSGPPAPSFAAP